MMIPRKKPCWSTGGDLVRSFQYRTGMSGDRLAILAAVWQKELGHLCGHWDLVGLKQGILYVQAEVGGRDAGAAVARRRNRAQPQ